MASIEHVNLSVSDPDASAALFTALFGWHVRWRGDSVSGNLTVHVGDEHGYLALNRPRTWAGGSLGHAKGQPLNHVGIVVDDLDAAERRAIAVGLTPFGHDDYDPGRRFYLFDPDGIEFEIVSYRGDGA
jgi:glyoxylase I family protein